MGGRRDSPLLCLIMSEDEKEQDTEEPTSEELATGEQVENDTSPIEAEGSEEAEESEESVDEFDDEGGRV